MRRWTIIHLIFIIIAICLFWCQNNKNKWPIHLLNLSKTNRRGTLYNIKQCYWWNQWSYSPCCQIEPIYKIINKDIKKLIQAQWLCKTEDWKNGSKKIWKTLHLFSQSWRSWNYNYWSLQSSFIAKTRQNCVNKFKRHYLYEIEHHQISLSEFPRKISQAD